MNGLIAGAAPNAMAAPPAHIEDLPDPAVDRVLHLISWQKGPAALQQLSGVSRFFRHHVERYPWSARDYPGSVCHLPPPPARLGLQAQRQGWKDIIREWHRRHAAYRVTFPASAAQGQQPALPPAERLLRLSFVPRELWDLDVSARVAQALKEAHRSAEAQAVAEHVEGVEHLLAAITDGDLARTRHWTRQLGAQGLTTGILRDLGVKIRAHFQALSPLIAFRYLWETVPCQRPVAVLFELMMRAMGPAPALRRFAQVPHIPLPPAALVWGLNNRQVVGLQDLTPWLVQPRGFGRQDVVLAVLSRFSARQIAEALLGFLARGDIERYPWDINMASLMAPTQLFCALWQHPQVVAVWQKHEVVRTRMMLGFLCREYQLAPAMGALTALACAKAFVRMHIIGRQSADAIRLMLGVLAHIRVNTREDFALLRRFGEVMCSAGLRLDAGRVLQRLPLIFCTPTSQGTHLSTIRAEQVKRCQSGVAILRETRAIEPSASPAFVAQRLAALGFPGDKYPLAHAHILRSMCVG